MVTLHDVKDATVAARAGDLTALTGMILSVDNAVPELPVVTVRDTAIDALCHGAVLAGVGVISCQEFRKGETVAVLSQKNEFVCLGRALVPSTAFKPGDTGLVVAPTTVFLPPRTYPRVWTKSCKEREPEKKDRRIQKKEPGKRIPLKKYPTNR
jgi:tRNA pseudouridine55 synthase/H/ACA ribonucleoprotein complex subunit 4